jgi:LPXTG-motif cell wall-anchored protein
MTRLAALFDRSGQHDTRNALILGGLALAVLALLALARRNR